VGRTTEGQREVARRERALSANEVQVALCGIFLAALGLRLFLVLALDRTVWGEEPSHLVLAQNFFSGRGYTQYAGIADILVPPGYPLLVGLLEKVVRDWMAASSLWFVLGGTAAILPLFLLGQALYDARSALIACLFFSVSPALVAGTLLSGSLTGPPYLFFLLSGLYFTYRMLSRDRMSDSLLAGLCLSAAYLIQLEGRFYFLVFLAYQLLRLLRGHQTDWRKAGSRLALFVLGFALLALPYLLYLHSVTGKWTFSGHSTQTYAAAKALVHNDPLLYDLEMWGLDPRESEVRYYSSEVMEIPLLTLFFDEPLAFTRDVLANMRRTAQLLSEPEYFGPGLMVLAALGLLAVSWDWRRLAREGFLLLSLLPLSGFWLFYVTRQDLSPALPILFLWAGRGMAYFWRWVERTGKNLRTTRARGSAELWMKSAVLLGVGLVLAARNERLCRNPYPPHIHELKRVAAWVDVNTPPHSVIMTRQPEIAFHANRRWVVLPHAPYPKCLQYARRHGVNYWVLELDVIRTRRPQLIPLLEGRQLPEPLQEIKRIEIPPNKVYVICAMPPGPGSQ